MEPVITPIVGTVPSHPYRCSVRTGRSHLVYEVSLINYAPHAGPVDRVDVLHPATGKTLGHPAQVIIPAQARRSRRIPRSGPG